MRPSIFFFFFSYDKSGETLSEAADDSAWKVLQSDGHIGDETRTPLSRTAGGYPQRLQANYGYLHLAADPLL